MKPQKLLIDNPKTSEIRISVKHMNCLLSIPLMPLFQYFMLEKQFCLMFQGGRRKCLQASIRVAGMQHLRNESCCVSQRRICISWDFFPIDHGGCSPPTREIQWAPSEVLSCVTTWMTLEDMMLSEVSRPSKDKYNKLSLV